MALAPKPLGLKTEEGQLTEQEKQVYQAISTEQSNASVRRENLFELLSHDTRQLLEQGLIDVSKMEKTEATVEFDTYMVRVYRQDTPKQGEAQQKVLKAEFTVQYSKYERVSSPTVKVAYNGDSVESNGSEETDKQLVETLGKIIELSEILPHPGKDALGV